MSLKKKLTYVLRYDPKVKKKKVNHLTLKKNTLRGLTFPIRQINAINLSSKLPGKTITQNQVRDVALPTKYTSKDFDPYAYKLFLKAGYNLMSHNC